MVNYSDSKVYRIVPTAGGEPGEVYIGSTTEPQLCRRMSGHRRGYQHWLNGKGGNVSSYRLFEKYGVDGCEIVLIESVNANSLDELRLRERFHIESVECVNRCVPRRSRAEYYTANADQIAGYKKAFYNANKDQISEYMKANAERISAYQKTYKAANSVKLAAYNKLYYEAKKANAATA
jgi:hypothetical protein